MDIERDGNFIEAGVWFIAAALVFWKAWKSTPVLRRTMFFWAATLAVFGGSDIVEAHTGAWWRPWWLFVWKATCVLALLFCFIRYFQLNKRERGVAKNRFVAMSLFAVIGFLATCFAAEFSAKPIPRMQVVPLPHHEFSFARDGRELTRFHFDPTEKRPFLFPVIGPNGKMLTRMGHPHDPFTHSHHNSMWVSHQFVNGVNFWEDRGDAQIHLVKIEDFTDGNEFCSATVLNAWTATNKTLMFERRRMTVVNQPNDEWLLLLDMRFEANGERVVLDKTAFGIAAVRVAKSIGVNDGGGLIRNSEGAVNEPGVHWKRARWVDYSGSVASNVVEGITFFDHPNNPNHPSVFHVRNDGWMGASLTFSNAISIETNKPLNLRYGFQIHRGLPDASAINAQWKSFATMKIAEFPKMKH